MKAWILPAQDGISALRLQDVPDPTPEAGEVLLEVELAALNPADRYLSEKLYPAKPPLPHILGRDGIGTVLQVGPNVSGILVGDRRVVLRGHTGVSRAGTFAQKVVVAADSLVEPPRGWSDAEAASASLVYLTAWQALTAWDDLPRPAVVLISGASGGVGVASIQLARAMEHTVIALSRGSSKKQALLQIGANQVFDAGDENWPRQALAWLSDRRVDLGIDNIAGPVLPQMIQTLGDRGRVSCVGMLAGHVPEFNTATLFFRRLRIGGVAVGAYGAEEGQAVWREVLATLQRTGVKPIIDRVFPFEQLPQAFARLGEGPMGKVLLSVKTSA